MDNNFSAAILGSQSLSLQKHTPPNLVSTSTGRENWEDSNMADASPKTDTSTYDFDKKNQRVMPLVVIYNILV